MNKSWYFFPELIFFQLIYPILLKFIEDYLIVKTEAMERAKRENDLPNLEEEYQQILGLKILHLCLFNYVDSHLIHRSELIEKINSENNLYQWPYHENVEIMPAICHQKTHSILTAKEGIFNFTVPFAAVVDNVELWGVNAIGFTENRKIILETSLDRQDCLEYSLLATLKRGFNSQYLTPVSDLEHIDLACSLVNYWSHLYFHWLLEGLTQLEALEYYSKQTGKKPILIIDKNPPQWKIRSLELMGYSIEDCRQWNGYRAKVKRLVICSKRREGGRVSIRACHWVRERILSNINSNAPLKIPLSENIFISRKKAKSRYITNEEEVINFLTPMGFIPYVLEDIDWQDQVRLFAQAKIIVAPHGAGLSNMLFSQKATIIEIFSRKVSHSLYTLAQGLGFKYGCMFCEGESENILVNYQELYNLIQMMLKEK